MPLRFLRWFCRPDLLKYIEGDLIELFEENQTRKGSFVAKCLFIWEVVKLFRPGIVKSFGSRNLSLGSLGVLHVKMLFRGLARDKSYAVTNILGLAVGFTAALIIYQFLSFEFNYDSSYPNKDRLYRINQSSLRNDEVVNQESFTWSALGEEAKNTISGIKELVRVHPVKYLGGESLVVSNPVDQNSYYEKDILYVDEGFLRVFDFSLAFGDAANALSSPDQVVISREQAIKYFQKEDVIGEILQVHGGSVSGKFKVGGVLEELPPNSHLKFDMLLSMSFLLSHYGAYTRQDGWGWTNFAAYILLEESADHDYISSQLNDIVDKRLGNELKQSGEQVKITLQPVTDIHLHSSLDTDIAENNNELGKVLLIATIGLITLIIAWLNYVNLSIGKALTRAKEIGVKKSLGAFQYQLFSQSILESVIVHLLAIVICLGLTFLLSSQIQQYLQIKLDNAVWNKPGFWFVLLLVLLIGAFIFGAYPAFILSRIKSKIQQVGLFGSSGIWMRRGLIFTQLTLSMLLITGAFLVSQQIAYMRSKSTGVEMEQVLVLSGPMSLAGEGGTLLKKQHQLFKQTILKNPNVLAISGSSNIPSSGQLWQGNMRKMGALSTSNELGDAVFIDADFLDVYDLEIVAGHNFSPEIQDYEALIINEKAVELFDLGDPHSAIGQSVILDGTDTIRVDGVVKDFHWSSLHSEIKPLLLGSMRGYNVNLSIRIGGESIKQTVEFIEDNFRALYPNDPFQCYFLDDRFNRQYNADEQFEKLVSLFSGLAVFIACIGLFSLVSFIANQKIKEIGIRKVLGANITNLLSILSRDFLSILFIAILLASLISIYIGGNWLENYAYRIELSPYLFLIPGLILITITLLTVSHKVISAALSNPVDSLRNE